MWLFGSHFGLPSGSPEFESDCRTTSSEEVYPSLGLNLTWLAMANMYCPFLFCLPANPAHFFLAE